MKWDELIKDVERADAHGDVNPPVEVLLLPARRVPNVDNARVDDGGAVKGEGDVGAGDDLGEVAGEGMADFDDRRRESIWGE